MQHAFPGDRLKISAEDWNRVRRVADNGSTGVGANPRRIYADVAIGFTSAGGIQGRTSGQFYSGTVTFIGIDETGASVTTDETCTAYNIMEGAVSGNAYVILARETRTLKWIVIAEDCPAPGS